jgi:hypothetical protein
MGTYGVLLWLVRCVVAAGLAQVPPSEPKTAPFGSLQLDCFETRLASGQPQLCLLRERREGQQLITPGAVARGGLAVGYDHEAYRTIPDEG